MTDLLLSDAEFVRRLSAHPDLRSRMESLLLSVEDETGDLKSADAAEMRVIQEMRQTGKVALQSWAKRQVDKTSQEVKQTAGVWSEGKKTLLAHHLLRYQHRRAPIPEGQQKSPPVCAKCWGQQPWLLGPAPARSDRFRC